MTGAQIPNPLDRLFFTLDDARALCGMSGTDIHGVCEFHGRLDLDGLIRALRCLHRRFPLTSARLERALLTGNPRWRLDAEAPDLDAFIRVHDCAGASAREVQAEHLAHGLGLRHDWRRRIPLQFDVLRGAEPGDVLLIRLPHALMDARGVVFLLEELAALYRQGAQPATTAAAGDERLDDWGALGPSLSPWGALRAVLRQRGAPSAQPRGTPIRLCPPGFGGGPSRLAHLVLRLSPAQTVAVHDAAARTCGFGRLGEFLRAAAICALHEAAAALACPGEVYTAFHLIELRRARRRGARLRNLFVAAPLTIPRERAGDCRAAADCIHEQLSAFLRGGGRLRQMALLRLLATIPAGLSARVTAQTLRTGRSWLPLGLESPPSLALGLLSAPGRPLRDFCGAELVNFYGLQPPSPAGFIANLNLTEDRMNVSLAYDARQIAAQTIEFLGRRFVRQLTQSDL